MQCPLQAQAQCNKLMVVLRTHLAQARCTHRQEQVWRPLQAKAKCTQALVLMPLYTWRRRDVLTDRCRCSLHSRSRRSVLKRRNMLKHWYWCCVPTWRKRDVLTDRCRSVVHCRSGNNVINDWCWSNVRRGWCDGLHHGHRGKVRRSCCDVLGRVVGFQPFDPFLQGAHCAGKPARRSIFPYTIKTSGSRQARHHQNLLETSSTPFTAGGHATI